MKECNCHKDSNGTLVCPEHSPTKQMSQRENQWFEFSDRVAKHLREYTVPQYGDVGEDEITNYKVKDCVEHVKRYAKRYGKQSRLGQQELDFVKIAHYVQCAWEKYMNGESQMSNVDQGIQGRLVVVDSEEDIFLAQSGGYELDSILSNGMEDYHFWKIRE